MGFKTSFSAILLVAVQMFMGTIVHAEVLEPEMVYVKGGCYQMGDTFGDGTSEEIPVHKVCVGDFYIGKYEVTQVEWESVMGSNRNNSKFVICGGNCPVENVGWDTIQEFIRILNQRTSKKYRLPTEAEWEYAARSGGKNEKYAGGNDPASVAWFDSNSGRHTLPVGQKKPNGLGIYDMSGNVYEWCQDWIENNSDDYYKKSPKDNPQGPQRGSVRVLRGGSWADHALHLRTTHRYRFKPDQTDSIFGFRLLRNP